MLHHLLGHQAKEFFCNSGGLFIHFSKESQIVAHNSFIASSVQREMGVESEVRFWSGKYLLLPSSGIQVIDLWWKFL